MTLLSSLNIVAIASSTGGPGILKQIFTGLPRLNASVIIVQHMPASINESIRKSLSECCPMDFHIALNNQPLEHGHVYIAPSDLHLTVNNGVIRLDEGQRVNFVCPSADVTMRSLKRNPAGLLVGVVLTGMGKDGAAGLAHIKLQGGITIAQDEYSSPIYGMPRAAVETGMVDFILPPDEIRGKLADLLGDKSSQPIRLAG